MSPLNRSKLRFRQTMIPILLTMGIALPGCAVWWGFLDRDEPIRQISIGYPICLAGIGIVFLNFAVMNMMAVRREGNKR
jgi:hypothetical protein